MRKRQGSRRANRSFKRGTGVKSINHKPAALGRRGGIRL